MPRKLVVSKPLVALPLDWLIQIRVNCLTNRGPVRSGSRNADPRKSPDPEFATMELLGSSARKCLACLLQLPDRGTQLGSAFADCVLKRGALIIEKEVRAAALEKIANTQSDLSVVERLKQKVRRSGAERAPLRFLICVRGKDNDR